MKCPNCGAGITDDSKFCQYCGAKLIFDTNVTETMIYEDRARLAELEYRKEKERRRRKTITIVSAALIILAAAFYGLWKATGVSELKTVFMAIVYIGILAVGAGLAAVLDKIDASNRKK